ncbi:adhesive plaque matrix protein-like [Macrobrachium rosenbergii]|uniref:adhesive plaque matrix protein-like n=1 Tax=Macrobrachium rosenbergii TaxID=79674 RepID=UPI0034D71DE4
MISKWISMLVVLMLLAELCLSQEVPGIAYMDILRTAPRKRVEGAAPDPDLPIAPLEPGGNRRYDVMLDYEDDYFEYVDTDNEEDAVVTTLERPQKPEAVLSTDITDYVLVSIDTSEENDPIDLPALEIVKDAELLAVDPFVSRTSVEKVPRSRDGKEQHIQRKQSKKSALNSQPYADEFLPERSEDGYEPIVVYSSADDPGYSYSEDYPNSPLSEDYYTNAYERDDVISSISLEGNFSAENTSSQYDSLDYLSASSQLYPSYVPYNYPRDSYAYKESTRGNHKPTYSPMLHDESPGFSVPYSGENSATTSVTTDTGSSTYSTVLSRRSNIPNNKLPRSRTDRQSRDEIMYYTGLQREIEKSSLLIDAIKDVRSREGRHITYKNREVTTTVTPVPDLRSIRSALGPHPLYRNLPGKSGPPRIRDKQYVYREYENEKDEYENMYLPARAKSLELSEIDEVREYFNTLVPKASYRPKDFPTYPSYPGQRIYLPPITTYKPSEIPKYKNWRPLSLTSKLKTKSPPEILTEHRNNPKYSNKLSTSMFKPSKPIPSQHSPLPVTIPYTSKPRVSSPSKHYPPEDSYQPKSTPRYYTPTKSPAHRHTDSKTYKKKTKYVTTSLEETTSTPHHDTSKPQYSTSGSQYSTSRPQYSTPRPYHSTVRQYFSTPRPHYTSSRTEPEPPPFYPSKSYTRQNSRQPSEHLYTEAGGPPRRPTLEPTRRQRRGPEMELSIDSKAKFPKFGYNIDRYFDDFPAFGFFDYEPSREVY